MRGKQSFRLLAALLALAMIAAACGGDDEESSGASSEVPTFDEAITIDYWLWDGNQQPFYEQCAADFTANVQPNISVNIEQFGWGDYWTGLTAAFASDSAPDVFTDHLARYPEF
ncbi:MAG: sugar ABC transporter substrate-binding protein, partial [Actinomycetota bacterium]